MTQAQYTAIVTGGSTGIGEDICRKMLDQGYTVISMFWVGLIYITSVLLWGYMGQG